LWTRSGERLAAFYCLSQAGRETWKLEIEVKRREDIRARGECQ
jgi:hypothetical protein